MGSKLSVTIAVEPRKFIFTRILAMEALVNLENFPNGIVSGLSTDELNFFLTESNDLYLKELDLSFFNDVVSFESLP